jgi:hypothetical protein
MRRSSSISMYYLYICMCSTIPVLQQIICIFLLLLVIIYDFLNDLTPKTRQIHRNSASDTTANNKSSSNNNNKNDIDHHFNLRSCYHQSVPEC